MIKKIFIFTLIIVLIIFSLGNLGKFFDISEEPKPVDIIVSLGGDNGSRIKKTLSLYKDNISNSRKIILTGMDRFDKIMKVYELDWRVNYLVQKGVDKENIVFNTEAQNTLEEILFIKKYMLAHNLHSAMFISDPPHSKRIDFFVSSVANYNDVNLSYLIVATKNDWWDKERYYTNPEAIIFVVNETIKLTYYFLQNLLGKLHDEKE